VEKDLFEIYKTPQLQVPSLIVGWQTRDIGKLSSKVIDFLNEKLGGEAIAEIKPVGFFPLGGAVFKDDIVHVPESKFWACQKNNLLLFKSEEPRYEKYKFLNAVLDLAEYHCQAKEVYTINATPSLTAHTAHRRILTVFNRPEFQKKLRRYGLINMDFEGPPAISSYLLWLAKRRGIPGVSLWPEIPFYLAAREDPQAIKQILSCLNKRFNLNLDFGELDFEIREQYEKIAQLRLENLEINKSISYLESGLSLGKEEQMKLAQEVYQLLEKRG